jgi:hypothetical protein
MKAVKKFATNHAKDIAERHYLSTWRMSEKQAWCVAFAFINIEEELTEDDV